jgi:hypothetical protein
MSRLRQSIRWRLRHVDSPPLPSSRGISSRSSPISGAAAHLPTIPEAQEAAASSRATLGASSSPAWGRGAGAAVEAGAAPAGASTTALLSLRAAGSGGASFEEVDLQQGEAAPGKHPQQHQQQQARRFATSLSCACFAGPLQH